jgi:fumarate hydratase class II
MVHATGEGEMSDTRVESDSLGDVTVAADKLWGAQTQRSLEHFSVGRDLMPREMISAYAILKRAAALANHAGGRLDVGTGLNAAPGFAIAAIAEIARFTGLPFATAPTSPALRSCRAK